MGSGLQPDYVSGAPARSHTSPDYRDASLEEVDMSETMTERERETERVKRDPDELETEPLEEPETTEPPETKPDPEES